MTEPMPAFARHVHIVAWLLANPLPAPDTEKLKHAAYTRRKGPKVREILLPHFEDGYPHHVSALMAAHPDIVPNTLRTALMREADIGVLVMTGSQTYQRGPCYVNPADKP